MNLSVNHYEPLPREEVIKAVERRRPARLPLVMAKWWGEGLREQYGDRLRAFDRIPDDVVFAWMGNPVDPARMNLSWTWTGSGAHDSNCVIDDWAKLDEFIAKLPDPACDPRFADLEAVAEQARREGRYLMYAFWNLFFERPWGLRGMENLLADFYTDPEQIHRLYDAMANVYSAYIRHAKRVLAPDGFWTSDDLGHQTGPMMGPEIFQRLIYPFYSHVGTTLRDCGMHFWLHSCGGNTLLLPDLIRAGVTVFHPVQKHTMNEREVARQFGGQITFLAGIDVQHTLQEKSPDEVRAEVQFLVDTFDRPEGGLCLAAGNGIVAGTPLANIEAFLDEALTYGRRHRAAFRGE